MNEGGKSEMKDKERLSEGGERIREERKKVLKKKRERGRGKMWMREKREND